MTQAWARALRRGAVPLTLGIVCWILSIPAVEDLDPLLKGLAGIFLVLGLVIVLATARTLGAEERRASVRNSPVDR